MIERKKVCGNCGDVGYSVGNYSDIMRCFLSALPAILSAVYFPSFILICVVISIVLYLLILNKKNKCPSCNAQNTMIDISTSKGKEIFLRYNDEKNYQEHIMEVTKKSKSTGANILFILLILLSFVISIILPPFIRGYNNAAEKAEQEIQTQQDFDWRQQLEYDKQQEYYNWKQQQEYNALQQRQYERQQENREDAGDIGGAIGTIAGGLIGYVAGALVGDFGGVVGAPAGAALGKAIGSKVGKDFVEN